MRRPAERGTTEAGSPIMLGEQRIYAPTNRGLFRSEERTELEGSDSLARAGLADGVEELPVFGVIWGKDVLRWCP